MVLMLVITSNLVQTKAKINSTFLWKEDTIVLVKLEMPFSINAIRDHLPILVQVINGQPLSKEKPISAIMQNKTLYSIIGIRFSSDIVMVLTTKVVLNLSKLRTDKFISEVMITCKKSSKTLLIKEASWMLKLLFWPEQVQVDKVHSTGVSTWEECYQKLWKW